MASLDEIKAAAEAINVDLTTARVALEAAERVRERKVRQRLGMDWEPWPATLDSGLIREDRPE